GDRPVFVLDDAPSADLDITDDRRFVEYDRLGERLGYDVGPAAFVLAAPLGSAIAPSKPILASDGCDDRRPQLTRVHRVSVAIQKIDAKLSRDVAKHGLHDRPARPSADHGDRPVFILDDAPRADPDITDDRRFVEYDRLGGSF